MENEYGVTPRVEQYWCIVDLLSRAGCLNDAEDMINPMPIRPNVIVWGALLGGCRIHKDISRGVHVVQRMLEINYDHSGSYVYLANVYASMGRLEDATLCRLRMWDNCVKRTPGCSWIEVNNTVHELFMGTVNLLGPLLLMEGLIFGNMRLRLEFTYERHKRLKRTNNSVNNILSNHLAAIKPSCTTSFPYFPANDRRKHTDIVSMRSNIFLQSFDIPVPSQDSASFLVISPTDNFPSQQETSSSQREQVGNKANIRGKETPGMVEAQVYSRDEVWEQLIRSQKRAVGSTNANELSSRNDD
ncbi:hypothetical protein GIB67_002974 [Kingdonia uniflora]|uniref:Pentatricopeptide repeat-containing protein n=1 Tax=Kingdonia uniflora TaxID=39325 RepID=A0A7J7MD92_9MAGN|nr:hypothetical protein GIB67_002974 [Kingdonia uniflora]